MHDIWCYFQCQAATWAETYAVVLRSTVEACEWLLCMRARNNACSATAQSISLLSTLYQRLNKEFFFNSYKFYLCNSCIITEHLAY